MANIVTANIVDALQVDLHEVVNGVPSEVDYDEDYLALALQNALAEIRFIVDIGGPSLTDVDDEYEPLIRVWAGYNIIMGAITEIAKEFKFDDQNISVDKQERQRTMVKLLPNWRKRMERLFEEALVKNNQRVVRLGLVKSDWV